MVLAVNNLTGFGGGGQIGPSSMSYLDGAVNSANASTYTFTSLDCGAADPDRKVVICVMTSSGGGSGDPTSVEIDNGGSPISFTKLIYQDGSACAASIWIGAVPAGTLYDVTVTFSGNESSCGISAYRLINYSSTPYDTVAYAGADPATGSIDATDSGVFIAASSISALSSFTWTNVTENFEDLGDTVGISSASRSFVSASAGVSITADTFGGNMVMVVVSLTPG